MWSYAVCLLPILIAVEAFIAFPLSIYQINLKVVNVSDTSVSINWNFRQPTKMFQPPKEIKFVLLLESEEEQTTRVDIFRNSGAQPFEYTLKGLTSMRNYNLKLSATTSRDNFTAEISFTTLERDWPAPVITDVASIPNEDFVIYLLMWEIERDERLLKYFRVEVCVPQCSELKRDPDEISIGLRISYEKAFTIRVVAVYEEPSVGLVSRYSNKYVGKTGRGDVLGTFLTTTRVMQEGNKLHLGWIPAIASDGPLPYYEIFVCDTGLTSIERAEEVLVSNVNPMRSDLVGNVFEMTVGNQYDERAPLLVIVRRTRAAVRFRIFFGHLQESIDWDFDWDTDTHLRIGPRIAEAFDFSANRLMHFQIRNCLTYRENTVDVCGNFSEFAIRSNPAEPSKVTKLEWELRSEDRVVVYWQEPSEPRGPIDGYKVSILEVSHAKNDARPKEFAANSRMRSWTFKREHPERMIKVGVAAYNFDPEESATVLQGEWSYVTITPEEHGPMWILLFALPGISCLLFVACLIIRHRRRAPEASPPEESEYCGHCIELEEFVGQPQGEQISDQSISEDWMLAKEDLGEESVEHYTDGTLEYSEGGTMRDVESLQTYGEASQPIDATSRPVPQYTARQKESIVKHHGELNLQVSDGSSSAHIEDVWTSTQSCPGELCAGSPLDAHGAVEGENEPIDGTSRPVEQGHEEESRPDTV